MFPELNPSPASSEKDFPLIDPDLLEGNFLDDVPYFQIESDEDDMDSDPEIEKLQVNILIRYIIISISVFRLTVFNYFI